MNKQVERKLNEAYQHIKRHINDSNVGSELRKMCACCECWYPNPEEMDYKQCFDKPCFKFWLAYVYLDWETAFE